MIVVNPAEDKIFVKLSIKLVDGSNLNSYDYKKIVTSFDVKMAANCALCCPLLAVKSQQLMREMT